MMLIRSFTFMLFIVIISYNLSIAQNSKAYKVRKITHNAIQFIQQDYKWSSEIFGQEDLDNFKQLLADDAKIANDILPDNNLNQQLEPFQYAQKFTKIYEEYSYQANLKVLYVSPVNFHSADLGSGDLTLHVQKAISGVNKNYGTQYQDTIVYEFDIVFEGVNGPYKIDEIAVHEKQGKYCIVEAYRKSLFDKNRMRNAKLITGGKTIQTDSNGRFLIKDVKNQVRFRTADKTIYEVRSIKAENIGRQKVQNQDKNVVELTFREPVFYGEIDGGYANNLPVNLNSGTNQISANIGQSTNYNAGIALGIIFLRNGRWRYSLSVGANYTKLAYNLNLSEHKRSFREEDDYGDEYERIVNVNNVVEKHELSYLSIPAKVNGLMNIYKSFYLDVGLGVNYYKNLSGQYKSSANAAYKGYYKDYFGVTITESGDNDNYDFGQTSIKKQKDLMMVKDFIALNFNGGLQYKISNRTFLKAGIDYQITRQPIFNKGDTHLSKDNGELNSLTNLSNDILLNRLALNLGISMNL